MFCKFYLISDAVSAAASKAKIRHFARKLNMIEEHLLGGLFVHFNDFFQNSSCRTHHNFTRKQNFLAKHIKILLGSLEIREIGQKFLKFSCRTEFYVLNILKFVNYRKDSSCRTPPKLPGAKHRDVSYLFHVVCWLLSQQILNCLTKELSIPSAKFPL